MLVDHAIIYVKAGRGGDGAVSFRREAFAPRGGPDGGEGGKGGDIVLYAKSGVDTLLDMTYRPHHVAKAGQAGMGKSRYGANAEDLIIPIPAGTQVYDHETGELIIDMNQLEMKHTVAHGGKGGRGNEAFKSPTQQTPRHAEDGEAGEEFTLRLELKMIADVGFVGKPNAGKSTMLSRVTRATPKTADYPFTTLTPQLGVLELDAERRMVIADIPGLIEGAAQGAGLGHEFLRHIERTRILVHVMEMEPTDGTDPIENFHTIRKELSEYSEVLAGKPYVIALNKMDLMGNTADDSEVAKALIEDALQLPVYPVSAVTGEGMRPLMERCWTIAQAAKRDEAHRI